MLDENIFVNFSEPALISSFSRYFHYTTEKSYEFTSIEQKKTENILCYILVQKKDDEIFDEICKIRNYEYNRTKGSDNIIFKPIFVLKYLDDVFNLNQKPFYNIITVKQLNEICAVCDLPEKSFARKDYQARRNIKFVCGGYIRKKIHDIKGCQTLEQKKAKFNKLQNQLNTDCINKIKEECGL